MFKDNNSVKMSILHLRRQELSPSILGKGMGWKVRGASEIMSLLCSKSPKLPSTPSLLVKARILTVTGRPYLIGPHFTCLNTSPTVPLLLSTQTALPSSSFSGWQDPLSSLRCHHSVRPVPSGPCSLPGFIFLSPWDLLTCYAVD